VAPSATPRSIAEETDPRRRAALMHGFRLREAQIEVARLQHRALLLRRTVKELESGNGQAGAKLAQAQAQLKRLRGELTHAEHELTRITREQP
jgi:chromosome segregation ATPase